MNVTLSATKAVLNGREVMLKKDKKDLGDLIKHELFSKSP